MTGWRRLERGLSVRQAARSVPLVSFVIFVFALVVILVLACMQFVIIFRGWFGTRFGGVKFRIHPGGKQQQFGGCVERWEPYAPTVSTLRELHLAQLFAHWRTQTISRYAQSRLPLRRQSEFATQALQAFSLQQVRELIHKF